MADNQESGLPDWANNSSLGVSDRAVPPQSGGRATNLLRAAGGFSGAATPALLDTRERRWPKRLAFPNADGFGLVPVDPVDGIESANNCVVLRCGLKEHLVEQTLTH
jgi:hypothetical protein